MLDKHRFHVKRTFHERDNPRSHDTVFCIPATEMTEWNQPEVITDVAKLLGCCENSEMLAELRRCDIPSEVFKIAARQLPCQKRNQIRQWVLKQNPLRE